MALFTVNFQDKAKKKLFKVCLVGTLNLCLKVRNQLHHPRQKKCKKKLSKIGQIHILPVLAVFFGVSQLRVIGFISSILHLFMHLETHVQSTHKPYSEESFFRPYEGGQQFKLDAISCRQPKHLFSVINLMYNCFKNSGDRDQSIARTLFLQAILSSGLLP